MAALSASSFRTLRGFSPRAVALLLAMAMIAAGIGFPPVSLAGATVASDDDQQQQPDSQPCEESPEESAEDEESAAGKHSAVPGCSPSLDPPALACHGVALVCSWIPAGCVASATPIRGPPASA